MADSEIIGGVSITVGVDTSEMDAAFAAALQKAVADGNSIAQALENAVKAPDISGISGSVDQIEARFRELAQEMATALGITLPAPDTSAVTGALAGVEAAAKQTGDAFSAADPAIRQAGQDLNQTGAAAAAAKDPLAGVADQLAKLAGISLSAAGIIGFAESIGEAFDSLTKADIVLTRLTGDADQASEMIGKLEALGTQDGLSMPGLLQAAEKMERLVPAGTDIVGILSQLADAATVTGGSIEGMANKFDMLVDSGKASDKSLATLGLDMNILKDAMSTAGVDLAAFGDNAKQAFAALDQHDRIVVLQTALQDLQGVAQDVADNTFAGKWHQALAQWDQDLGIVQKDMQPVADSFGSLKPIVNDIAAVLVAFATGVKTTVDQIVGFVSLAVTAFTGLASAVKAAATGDVSGALTSLKDAFANIGTVAASMADSLKTDLGGGLKTIQDLLNQTTATVKPTIDSLDNLGSHGKGAADKIAAAGVAVQKFMDQIAAGGTVAQLQKDFENASAAINKLATADLPAAIRAMDDYTQAQIANGANASVMMQALQEYQSLLDKLAKEDLPAAIAGEQKLVDELVAAKEPLGLVEAAFEKEEAMIQKLAKEDYPAAIAAQEKLVTSLQAMPQYASAMNAAIDTLNKMLNDHEAALNKSVAAQQKFVDSIKNVALGIPGPQKALDDMNKTLDLIGASSVAMPAKMSPLNQALIDAGRGAEAAGTSLSKIPAALDSIHTPITKVITDLDQLAADALKTGHWDDYEAAMEKVEKRFQEMSKTDLPDAVTQFEAVIQEMIKAQAPPDLITAALNKLSPVIQKMTDEDLPGAKAAWDTYLGLLEAVPSAIKDIEQAQADQIAKDQTILDAMKARGDAYGYILDQQAKVLQGEIAFAEKAGQDANDMVLGLEKVRLQQEANKLSTHGLADAYVGMINDTLKGFDQLGGAMADAIVNGKNLGEALINEFKKIGQSILSDIINLALLPLKQELIKMISSFLPEYAAKTAAATAGTTALGAASTTTAAAQTTMAVTATTAAGAVTTLGIASSLAAIQLNTMITAIAAAIGAIAAIVGDVYLAAIDSKLFITNTTLAAIKNDVANMRADLWSQYNHMYDRLGELKNDLDAIKEFTSQLAGAGLGTGGQQATSDLDTIASVMAHLLIADQAINFSVQALNQTTTPLLQQIIGDLMTINTSLFMINTTLSSRGGSGDSSSSSQSQSQSDLRANNIIKAISDGADAVRFGAQDNTDRLAPPIGIIGRILDATASQELRDGQRQYNAAMSVADQLAALSKEYDADMQLMNDALSSGNMDLAQTYQQAAEEIQRQMASLQEGQQYGNNTTTTIAQYTQESYSLWQNAEAAQAAAQAKVNADIEALTEAIASGNQKAIDAAQKQLDADNAALVQAQQAAQQAAEGLTRGDAQIVSAENQTGASVGSGASLMVTAVGGSGASIVQAVNNAALTIGAAVQATAATIAGSMLMMSGVRAPTSGAGTGGSTPGIAPGNEAAQQPTQGQVQAGGTGATVVGQPPPSFPQGSGQMNVVPLGAFPDGHGGWTWPSGAPQNPQTGVVPPPLNPDAPHFATGGMIEGDGTLVAEKGEAVLRPEQAAAFQNFASAITNPMPGIAPAAPPETAAQQQARSDASNTKQNVSDRLDLLNNELATAMKTVGPDNVQTRELQMQIADLLKSIAGDTKTTADNTDQSKTPPGPRVLGPPDQAPMPDFPAILGVPGVRDFDPGTNSGAPPPGSPKYFDSGAGAGGTGTSWDAQMMALGTNIKASGILPPGNAAPSAPPPTPHNVFSGYNPYGSSQPFALGAFEMGGQVPATGMYQLHAQEEVLSPDLSKSLRQMVGGGGGSAGGKAAGPMTFNVNLNVSQVQDGRKLAQQFVSHMKTIIPAGAFGQ